MKLSIITVLILILPTVLTSSAIRCGISWCGNDTFCYQDPSNPGMERCKRCAEIGHVCFEKHPPGYYEGCKEYCKRQLQEKEDTEEYKVAKIRCEEPVAIEHGRPIFEGTTVGSHLQIECDDGFHPAGIYSTIICSPDGTWNTSRDIACVKDSSDHSVKQTIIQEYLPAFIVAAIIVIALLVGLAYLRVRKQMPPKTPGNNTAAKERKSARLGGTTDDEINLNSIEERHKAVVPSAPALPEEMIDETRQSLLSNIDLVDEVGGGGLDKKYMYNSPHADNKEMEEVQQALPIPPRASSQEDSDVQLNQNQSEEKDQNSETRNEQHGIGQEPTRNCQNDMQFNIVIEQRIEQHVNIHPSPSVDPPGSSPDPTTFAVQPEEERHGSISSSTSGVSSMSDNSHTQWNSAGPITQEHGGSDANRRLCAQGQTENNQFLLGTR